MILKKNPFLISLLAATINLAGGFTYFSLESSMGLDAYEVYLTYCIEGREISGIGFLHNFFISSTCIKDFTTYFFLFLSFQSILILLVAYQIGKLNKEHIIVFICFLLTPSIFFYGSTFTKDGMTLCLLLISFLLMKTPWASNVVTFLAILIRPHILAALPTKYNAILGRSSLKDVIASIVFLLICIYLFYLSSYAYLIIDEASIKFRVTQNIETTGFYQINSIFYVEVLIIMFFLWRINLLNPFLILAVISLLYFAGYNPNVFSRMAISLLFASYLFSTQKIMSEIKK